MAEEVQRRLAADGLDDLRFGDGVLFQHLVEGPRGVTDLAARMGVSQQAASKAVAGLERRGYIERSRGNDARIREVALSDRGRHAIERGRAHRAALAQELADRFGPRRTEAARRLLLDVVDSLGGAPAIRGRRVRPPF